MSDGDAPKPGEDDKEKFIETAYQSRESSAATSQSSASLSGVAKKPTDPLIGSTVSGYVVKAKIGSGGMGIVYSGEQPVIGKRVAIKVLRPEIAENPEQVKRLVEEARAVNTVGHRGIIDVFGFGEVSDGRQCIVMEFLDGEALMDLLARNQKEHRAMPIAEVMVILEEVLSALGAAHGAGVIHRDLKPSNIFLCRQRDGSRYVKILDFGIAKLGIHGTTPQTHASMLVGTPSYMAPEQARGGMISPSLDLYALGVIAYEMITGVLPFLGNSVVEVLMKHAEEAPKKPSAHLMSIPDDVDELILKLLEKKPENRYATAEAVRQDVVRIRKSLTDSTARRTELDLELDKRLKKQLQTMIVPESAASIDLGSGEDATLPPQSRRSYARLPSVQQQQSMIEPLPQETRLLPSPDNTDLISAEAMKATVSEPLPPREPSYPRGKAPSMARLPAVAAPAPVAEEAKEELTPASKAPLFIVVGLLAAVVAFGVWWLTRNTQPVVVEIPIQDARPKPAPVPEVVKPPEPVPEPVKPPEPTPAPEAVKPPEPAPEPVVAKPEPVPEATPEAVKPEPVAKPVAAKPEPVAKPKASKKDVLVDRFTKLEAALTKRDDKATELKTAQKFLEKLKTGALTPEQLEQVEVAAKRLEDSLKE